MRLSEIRIATVLTASMLLAGCQGDTLPDIDGSRRTPVSSPATPPRVAPGSCHVIDGRADQRCTPGAVNPDVAQETIRTTICVPGWTATIRPPAAYTNLLKTAQMQDCGETGLPSGFEEDHLVNFGIGGAPQDPRNLFPQPRTGARSAAVKDQEEVQLQRDVCAGRTTLAAARAQILQNWTR